ncbi:BQ5605_C002g01691 [Microbotryum silenes-dioicae]|uniref:BQ5605_C002g01691 protein n=1 Tax=Microbotryum silenes-dioicae TaxID=796604 RepID=A0A2X0M3K1_9BASI|nr:BQ5605_C002g01691 [Microbotryum silenes-dioicae]
MYFADWCWRMCYQKSFSQPRCWVVPPTLPSLHPQGLSDEVRKPLGKLGAIIDLAEASADRETRASRTAARHALGKLPKSITKAQKQQFWLWLIENAVKKDVHRKLIYGVTLTCVLHHLAHTASDGCPHCGERDNFTHFFFIYDHSREYWRLILQLLSVALGQAVADGVQPSEVESPHIMLGVRASRLSDSIVVRVVLAIAFNKLYLARWHRHKIQI